MQNRKELLDNIINYKMFKIIDELITKLYNIIKFIYLNLISVFNAGGTDL